MNDPVRAGATAGDAAASPAGMLRRAKLRVTRSRVVVLEAILSAPGHLWDADRVVRAFMQRGWIFNPGSAYRILRELETAGLLRREWRPGHSGMKSGYRLLQANPHAGGGHEMTCRICGRSIAIDDAVVLEHLLRFAERHQMDACNLPVTLLSVCHAHAQ